MNQPQVAILILVLSFAGWMSRTDAPAPVDPVVSAYSSPSAPPASTVEPVTAAAGDTVEPPAPFDGPLQLRADPMLATPRATLLAQPSASTTADAVPAIATDAAAAIVGIGETVIPSPLGAASLGSASLATGAPVIASDPPVVAGAVAPTAAAVPASARVSAPSLEATPAPEAPVPAATPRRDDDPMRKAAAANVPSRAARPVAHGTPARVEGARGARGAGREVAARATHPSKLVVRTRTSTRELLPLAYRFSCMYC